MVTAPTADLSLLDEGDQDPMRAAHAAAAATITSQQFVDALCKLDGLSDRVDGTPMKGYDVARKYFGLDKDTPRLPVRYLSGGIGFRETADTRTRTARQVPGGATIPAHARVTVGSATVERATGDTEHVACAVNTIAHEWTHSVSRTGAEFIFQDTGHNTTQDRLVSYSVGSLAQCVYLAQHGYPDLDLASCVKAIGTHSFDQGTCSRAGAQALRTHAAVHSP